jgi:hypothetical protein
MKRKIIDYTAQDSGNTETHIATDNYMSESSDHYNNALEEGFASAEGIRGVTAASGGRVKHPEKDDNLRPDPVPADIENENSGLADN